MQKLHVAVLAYEEAYKMTYIMSVEQMSMERGLQQGEKKDVRQSIALALKMRFGDPLSLYQTNPALLQPPRLTRVYKTMCKSKSVWIKN